MSTQNIPPSPEMATMGRPSVRLLTPDEISQMPRTFREQSVVRAIVEQGRQRHYPELIIGLGGAALQLSLIKEQLETVTEGFGGVIRSTATVRSLGGQVVAWNARYKDITASPGSITRVEQKAVVYAAKAHKQGIAPQQMPDVIAGELVIDADTEELNRILRDTHRDLCLPNAYPGGLEAIEVGGSSNANSANNYPYRKVIVPLRCEDAIHLAELRMLNPAEKAYDMATRSAYVLRREQEYLAAQEYCHEFEVPLWPSRQQ